MAFQGILERKHCLVAGLLRKQRRRRRRDHKKICRTPRLPGFRSASASAEAVSPSGPRACPGVSILNCGGAKNMDGLKGWINCVFVVPVWLHHFASWQQFAAAKAHTFPRRKARHLFKFQEYVSQLLPSQGVL